jgi:CTP:molybdopterin cytidylyltransferase MocA
VVLNESYRQGMGTSLKAGLSAVDSQSADALIVLADQPFVGPAIMNRLIAEQLVVASASVCQRKKNRMLAKREE